LFGVEDDKRNDDGDCSDDNLSDDGGRDVGPVDAAHESNCDMDASFYGSEARRRSML